MSLHKWTFAPVGTGFLYVKRSRIRETWPLMAAGERRDDDIRKFEEIGTHPAANFSAICEAITFNQNIGIERKAARLRYLKDRWATALAKNPKVKILHSSDPAMACGIGICFSCVTRVKTADGWDYRRVCVDGPVFDAGCLEWKS